MQKLTFQKQSRSFLLDPKGSALVSVVVFAILMGISGAAYLGVTTNGVNREVQGLHDAQAFAAAESGLLMGTQWLSKQPSQPSFSTDSLIIGSLTIDGNPVTIYIKEEDGTDRLFSLVRQEKLPYAKRVSWDAQKVSPVIPPGFSYGVLSDHLIKIERPVLNNGTPLSIHSNSLSLLMIEKNVAANITSVGPVKVEATVDGNVTAPVVTNEGTVTGTIARQAVSPVAFPVVDLTPWINLATANGQVYTNPSLIPSNPTGGVAVLQVSGTDNVEFSKNFSGTLIFFGTAGMVTIADGVINNAAGNSFSIAAQGVDVKIKSDADVDGLIYIKEGNLKIENPTVFSGQLVVQGRDPSHLGMQMPTNPGPVSVHLEQTAASGTFQFNYQQTVPIPPGQSASVSIAQGSWREDNLKK